MTADAPVSANASADSIGGLTDDDAQDALRRADAKATTLLQLVGLALAGVMALVSTKPAGAAAVLLWLALAPTLISIVLLLVTILPWLGAPVPGTWLHAAVSAPGADTSVEAARANADTHLRRNARRALRKYRCLQVAVVLLITGLVFLVWALALIA